VGTLRNHMVMTLVPGGAFIMGKSDDDVASIQDAN
jgi:hypothetical protein